MRNDGQRINDDFHFSEHFSIYAFINTDRNLSENRSIGSALQVFKIRVLSPIIMSETESK